MDWKKSNKLIKWHSYLANLFSSYVKEARNYRCKIIRIETDKKTSEVVLLVKICGIKSQVVSFSPKELVTNNDMIGEFSPFDARAITFFSLRESFNSSSVSYSIMGQDFINERTIFIIKESNQCGESRKSAQELYRNAALLDQFNRDDLINIISTAIQEQTIEDLQKIWN